MTDQTKLTSRTTYQSPMEQTTVQSKGMNYKKKNSMGKKKYNNEENQLTIKCNSMFHDTLGKSNSEIIDLANNKFLNAFLYATDYYFVCLDNKAKKIIERGIAQKLASDLDGATGFYVERKYEKLGWNKAIIKRILLNNSNINILDKEHASVIGYISDYFDINIICLINNGRNAILIDRGNNIINNNTPLLIFSTNASYNPKESSTESTEKPPVISYKPIQIDGNILLSKPPNKILELYTTQQIFSTKYKEVKIKSIYKRNANEIYVLAKNNGISINKTVDDVIKNKTVNELRKELKALKDQGQLVGF